MKDPFKIRTHWSLGDKPETQGNIQVWDNDGLKWGDVNRIAKERKKIKNIKKEKSIILEGVLDLIGREELRMI